MSDTRSRERGDAVPALVVLGRVWLGGVLWGAVGGVVLAALAGTAATWTDPGHVSSANEVVAMIFGVLVLSVLLGAPAGVAVGTVMAPVAALVLLAGHPDAEPSPALSTVWTLGLFLFVAVVAAGLAEGEAVQGLVVASLICLVAAWPMHRTLRRALRPLRRRA